MTTRAIMDTLVFEGGPNLPQLVPVEAHLCLGPPGHEYMSAGVCTAMMATALERRFDRPLIQCSTFFLRAPPLGSIASVGVEPLQEGDTIVLARADLSSDGTSGAVLQASLGAFHTDEDLQETGPLDAPPPEACESLTRKAQYPDDLHAQLDIRLASRTDASSAAGTLRWWVRAPESLSNGATAFLALIADAIPEATHHAHGRPAGATSLDNQLRIFGRELSPWLFCETRLSTLRSGVFHAATTVRHQAGSLLARAGQTWVVKEISA
jgi:acyl-CoA thioesterase II